MYDKMCLRYSQYHNENWLKTHTNFQSKVTSTQIGKLPIEKKNRHGEVTRMCLHLRNIRKVSITLPSGNLQYRYI